MSELIANKKEDMKFIFTLVTILLVASCTYRYPTYGIYGDTNVDYHSKKNYKMDVNVEVSYLTTGVTATQYSTTIYYDKKPLQDLVIKTLQEYNISVNIQDGAPNPEIPTIEVYSNQRKNLSDGLSMIAGFATLGIIPVKEVIKYEVIFTKGKYKIKTEETENHLTGWFLIPYSKKSDEALVKGVVVRNMIRSVINKAILDKKIESDFVSTNHKIK